MCVLEEREKRRMRQKYINERNREKKGPDSWSYSASVLKRKNREGEGRHSAIDHNWLSVPVFFCSLSFA